MIQNRDHEEEGVQSVYFSGGDMDCETCGWNYDEGEFHIWPDGEFYLSTRYGCYGGSYTEDRDEVISEIEHCATFFGDIEHEVSEIKRMLKGASHEM